MIKQPDNALPFSDIRQKAVLGHLLCNELFFKQCVSVVEPSWFHDSAAAKIWETAINFYKAMNYVPSLGELQAYGLFRLENQQVINKMNRVLLEAKNLADLPPKPEFQLAGLLPEFTAWLHSRYFHQGISAAEVLYNGGKCAEAYVAMEQAINLIRTNTFDANLEFQFEKFVEHFEGRKLDLYGALTFGNQHFDRLLLPEAEGQGSLRRGDSTIVLAPTNIGKTTTMLTIGTANLFKAIPADILLITHEGSQEDIVDKLWCNMMNCNRAELYELSAKLKANRLPPEVAEKFKEAMQLIRDHLTYIPMNRPGLTVEEVEAAIRRQWEKRVAQKGKGYDLVIDDYPAKLTSQRDLGDLRNVDAHVYNYFVQLALELRFHFLGAQQTNRTGAKVNKGEKGFADRLIVPEDSNEAYGPMQTATNVISVNRDHWSEIGGYTTYYIGKSRSSIKGWAVVCKGNWSNAISHGNVSGFGATWYQGNTPLRSKIDLIFKEHVGKQIGNHVYEAAVG